jgi:hypothetical protein
LDEDKHLAPDLVKLLQHFDVRVSWDQAGNRRGAPLGRLRDAIERSEFLCLVLSGDAGNRAWVEDECDHFVRTHRDRELDKAVIVFEVAAGPLPPALQQDGTPYKSIDARPSFIDGFVELLLTIKKEPV